MKFSEGRKSFLEKASQKVQELSEDLGNALKHGQPDRYFEKFNAALQETAASIFSGSLASCSELYRQQAAERRALLARRLQLRPRLSQAANGLEEEEVKEELKQCSK
eukprot:435084-Pyramimonas_sp.AAC.1